MGLVTNGTHSSQMKIPNGNFPDFFVNGKRPLSRQLRQRSRGKEGNTRFANEGTFAFCLCSFWVSLLTLKSKVRERAFSFS